MYRTILLLCALVVPVGVYALDYSNRTLLYTDAPFRPAEAAGINVLTSLGAVEGNPDGTFRPNRTLNRAEFLKIVLLSSPNIRVSSSDADNCFPDVRRTDWFSRYVCLAKKADIVGGYPDGKFKPGNPVNYAEALKILGEIYDYTAWTPENAEWYEVYSQAAKNHKTELPINITYDHKLTRGQMARLAAAYRAEHDGELEWYREAERTGALVVGDTEEIEEIEETEEESGTGAVVETGTGSTGTGDMMVEELDPPELPSRTRLLQVGERSGPVADGRFTVYGDDSYLRIVEVEIEREIDSLKTLYLRDGDGRELGELKPDIYDDRDLTWKISYDKDGAPIMKDGEPLTLVLDAELNIAGQGGISEEQLDIESFKAVAQGINDNTSRNLVAQIENFPSHQTVLGKITAVTNADETTGELTSGNEQLLASFAFSGYTVTVGQPAIESLHFKIHKSFGIAVSDYKLRAADQLEFMNCSISEDETVNCVNIQRKHGEIGDEPQVIELYGDVLVGGTDPGKTLQVTLNDSGEFGTIGAVGWSDGTGHFRWSELESPVAKGTVWAVD